MELDHTASSNEGSRDQSAEGVICIKRREREGEHVGEERKMQGERRDCRGEEKKGGREVRL